MPGKTDKQIMYKINSLQQGDKDSNVKLPPKPVKIQKFAIHEDENMSYTNDNAKYVKMDYSNGDDDYSIERLPSGEQYKIMINNGSQSGSSSISDSSNHVPQSLKRNKDGLGIIKEESQYSDNQSINEDDFFKF